jgi:SET domain-containing protein
MTLSYLQIKNTKNKGRGVFTNQVIEENTIIEVAPVIIMSNEDRIHLDKTLLHDYIFEWGHNTNLCCMALGYIPIYNHSYKSNCIYIMDYNANTIIIKSIITIKKNQELTINYNGEFNDETPVWFHKQ